MFITIAFAVLAFSLVLKDAQSRRLSESQTPDMASKIHAVKFHGGTAFLYEGFGGDPNVVRRVICFDRKNGQLGSRWAGLGVVPRWADDAGYLAMLSTVAELGFAMARAAVDPFEVAAEPLFEQPFEKGTIAERDEKLSWHGKLSTAGFEEYTGDGTPRHAFRIRVGAAKVWGFDLIRALTEANAQEGDLIQVMLIGRVTDGKAANRYAVRVIYAAKREVQYAAANA